MKETEGKLAADAATPDWYRLPVVVARQARMAELVREHGLAFDAEGLSAGNRLWAELDRESRLPTVYEAMAQGLI